MRWFTVPSTIAGGVAGLIVVVIGLYASRPDVVVLAVPILLSVAWVWDRRPREQPDAESVRVDVDAVPESESAAGSPRGRRATRATRAIPAASLGYRVRVDSPSPVTLVHLRFTVDGIVRHLIVSPRTAADLTGRVAVAHSGRQQVLQLEARLLAGDGGIVSSVLAASEVTRVIRPGIRPIDSLPVPTQLHGASGIHESRRRGEGGGFRDLGLFEPGDRLRRIDWKATARRAQRPGELYVRRTFQSADATVFVVIDSRDDLGARVADWSHATPEATGATSMDLAREAAVSYAAAYIAAGDSVGMHDLGTTLHTVPPQGGRRHLDRLVRTVSLARPQGRPQRGRRAPVLAQGALVLVLSTFLDDEATEVAVLWRAAGHQVIAVDVLPRPDLAGLERNEVQAFRVVMLEREQRIHRARAAGIDIVRWQSAGLDARASAPASTAVTQPAETSRATDARWRYVPRPRRADPRLVRPMIGLAVPAWTLRVLLAVIAATVTAVQLPLVPALIVLAVVLIGLAVLRPGSLTVWWLIVVLALSQFSHAPTSPGWHVTQLIVAVAGIHALHVIGQLSLNVPWRARLEVRALVPVLGRFVVIQLVAQAVALAAVALGGAAAGSSAGFGAVLAGALAVAALAAMLVVPLVRGMRE